MAEKKEAEVKPSGIQTLYEWVETFCLALLGVVVVFTFICRFVTVSGESMTNTLNDGDRLIISNLFYTPKKGDIVVIQDSQSSIPEMRKPIIKRIIATEGETVDIDHDTWTVTVTHLDGSVEVLEEDYVRELYDVKYPNEEIPVKVYEEAYEPEKYVESKLARMTGSSQLKYPHVVKEGCVFVMGDNRTNSLDSRIAGDIDVRKILGKAYVRIFPITDFGFFF